MIPPPVMAMTPGPFPKHNLNVHRSLPQVTTLMLACLVTMLISPGRAQTDSDVHIIPQSAPQKPSANTPNTTAADQSPSRKRSKPLVSNVDLVLVPVTVTDAMNRAIVGLEKKNFQVYEDERPQAIRDLYSEDAPLALGVIFDTSKSMSNKIEAARQSVLEFFKAANPKDDFFIITFSDRPQLLVDFTPSVENIQNQLLYAVPQGHTSLLDAIYMGLTKIRHSRYDRRALLIISDGGDNRSRYTASEIKRIVAEADVQLYGIGLFDTIFQTPEERMGKQLLNSITEATGGRTFAIKDIHDLPKAANRIALELRNQYFLAYRSDNTARDGKWRKIKVKLIPPDGMSQPHVYAKSGYYSPIE